MNRRVTRPASYALPRSKSLPRLSNFSLSGLWGSESLNWSFFKISRTLSVRSDASNAYWNPLPYTPAPLKHQHKNTAVALVQFAHVATKWIAKV
jgi:hypothetical protein